jgi:hypothetical protein
MIIAGQADDVNVTLGKMTDTQSRSIIPEHFSGPLGVPFDVAGEVAHCAILQAHNQGHGGNRRDWS